MNEPTTQMTLDVLMPAPELSKGKREYHAFLCLLPELLKTHRGKFVAIHDGRVVDSDTDDIVLVKRVHAQVGYVPIHVGLVTDQLSIIRVPHYRDYRPGSEGG